MLFLHNQIIRAVLFDMDGVLAHSYEAHRDAWAWLAEREGRAWDMRDFMVRTFGRGNRDVMRIFYDRDDLTDDFIHEIVSLKEERFRRIYRESNPVPPPGLVNLLELLKEHNVGIALGSSAPRPNIETTLEALKIAEYFSASVSADDVTHAKPDPEIFIECARRLGAEPQECVVVEDSTFGMQAGRTMGAYVVGITTTHPRNEIADHCDFVVEEFQELFDAFLASSKLPKG